jgi:hypothetical protein
MDERLPKTLKPRQDIPFVYDAYRRLMQELGAIDGLSSAIVLGDRYLTSASLKSTADGTSDDQRRTQRAFVEVEATRFQVSTRFVDFDTLETRSVQLLLVGVFQQAEAFCESMREERGVMGSTWLKRDDRESKMHHLMRALGAGFASNLRRVGPERYDLLEYYRLLRNAFVHRGTEKSDLEKLFTKVCAHRDLVRDEYGLAAPNHFDSLTYDDYLLATRVMKYLATDFCRIAEPRSSDELCALLKEKIRQGDGVGSTLFAQRSDPKQLKKALRGWFRQHYNYWIEEFPEIEAAVLAWIESVPTKRERRRAGAQSLVAHFSTA